MEMSEVPLSSEVLNRQFPTQTYPRADFSGKDIRGKDFSGVTLQGASFRGVTAGLSQTWSIGLYLLVAFLSILVGILAAYAGALAAAPTATDPHSNLIYDPAYTTISLTLSGFAFAIMLLRGINATLAAGSVLVTSTAIAAMAFIPNQIAQNAVSVLFAALALAGSIAAVFNMALAIALTKTLADQKAFLGSLLLALLGIIWGSLLGVGEKSGDWAYIVSAVFGLATLALGTYAGRQAMRGDLKYPLIRAIALALYARGGTSFRGATLIDADFTEASLEGADFRGALLTRTCWFHTRNLDRALTGGTYLANPYIRQLVVAKDASNLPAFDHLDLREVNLAGANLQKASFIGADLSQATLAGANLAGAKLAKAQLYQTDLSEATLTGANIQDWGISTETKLSGVFCDFIYMRLPTEDDPDACRKPDSKHETFKPGDFTDFISPIVKTLELYHEQNVDMRQVSATFKTLDLFHHGSVDPSAAAVALQQLAERHPEAGLEVIVLEGRRNEKIHLQARVAGDIDRSQLSAEYFAQYEQVKSLPYSDLQELLAAMAEKDKRIQSYEKLLENALQQPKFYVETYQSEGTTVMSNKEIKLLVLAASPQDQVRLNLEKEVKVIDLALRLGKHREQFTLDQRWGVSRGELQDILLTIEPDIVHFCGHGAKENGLVLQNDQKQTQLVSTTALAELFELVSTYSKPIPCIVLNACYSEAQADAMSPFIDYIVGMDKEIGDNAAINFSKGFYRSLSNGLPYEAAFRFGRNAIDMESIPEHLTPVLKGRAIL